MFKVNPNTKPKYDYNIMLDLEFFGTEEDMLKEYSGSKTEHMPIVSSIGIVVQDNHTRQILFSNKYPLSLKEQVARGAKFGERCMVDFWTKEPLFGREMRECMKTPYEIGNILEEIGAVIRKYKYNGRVSGSKESTVRLIGNNLLADNSKLMRLWALYAKGNNWFPITYHEHFDLQGLKRTTESMGIKNSFFENLFVEFVQKGKLTGYPEPALHDPVYDCYKQLFLLNGLEDMLLRVKAMLEPEID